MNVVEGVGGGRPGAEELLLRVAWFYYKDELTQDETASRLAHAGPGPEGRPGLDQSERGSP